MTTDMLKRFSRVKALVVGDLMVDEYLWGRVDRISPEAPVPVVAIERENLALGGSGNVINNLRAMGAKVCAVGTVGRDNAGTRLLKSLETLAVDTSGILVDKNRPTTRKTRVIASNQQIVRIDREICEDIPRDICTQLMSEMEKALPSCGLVIISDYNKGVVTRDLVSRTALLAKELGIPVLADPKSRDFSKYDFAALITPNQKEASLAANMTISSQADLYTAGEKILEQTRIDKLVITCGKDGMILFERGKNPHDIPSRARQVFDVSGAGDTVISFLGLGLASEMTLQESAQIANAAAGIVVAKAGTATVAPEELARELAHPFESC